MSGVHKKDRHTWANLQLSAAGLFQNVWLSCGHQALKVNLIMYGKQKVFLKFSIELNALLYIIKTQTSEINESNSATMV